MKHHPNAVTTIYEEDLKEGRTGDPRYKDVPYGFTGVTHRVPVNPGKRPRRKKGESPLD